MPTPSNLLALLEKRRNEYIYMRCVVSDYFCSACCWPVLCDHTSPERPKLHRQGLSTMKNIYYLLACLTIVTLACGMQAQTPSQLGSVSIEPTVYTSPVKVLAVEPTEAAPVYMTTGALNVRSEPNADSTILGTLAPFTEIQIFITDEPSDGCYLGEWYQIFYTPEGGKMTKAFVCSLWVVRK